MRHRARTWVLDCELARGLLENLTASRASVAGVRGNATVDHA